MSATTQFFIVAIAATVFFLLGQYLERKSREVKHEILIKQAVYGADERLSDVTALLQEAVDARGAVDVFNGAVLRDVFGDPAYGAIKKLTVTYEKNGEQRSASFIDSSPAPRISFK